jgi:hypothetical protein
MIQEKDNGNNHHYHHLSPLFSGGRMETVSSGVHTPQRETLSRTERGD